MEAKTKKKATAVAIATAVVLILAGTMAYLADASGTIRNIWDGEHIRVQINETGITDSDTGEKTDNGDKDYTVLPGTTDSKDPTITVDTDTDAYVFAVVKDTINSHGAQIVDYTIANGWVELDKTGLTEKEINKYVDILNNKTRGDLTVKPTDENTKIYYRIVHGKELAAGTTDHNVENHRFTFPVLTDNQISYPSSLTNEDMNTLAAITDPEKKALIFQTYAVQMEPWCPESEVAGADATTDAQKGYAKNAWNEAVIRVTGVSVSPTTLNMNVGDADQTLTATVDPANATNKKVTWTSSNAEVATVDENGVVHAVGEGTATITVTTDDKGKTATCEVTVTAAGPTFGYAVQYKGNTNGEAVFWPAMGVNATASGVDHGGSHTGKCIHDSDVTWDYIKANPDEFAACITNGCTKKVLLDETTAENEFGMTATAGDGGGIVTYAPWGETGTSGPGSQTPTYDTVLTKIKGAMTDGPSNPTMFLLSYEMLGRPTLYQPDDSRIVYNQEGVVDWWWLSDPNPNSNDYVCRVYNGGVLDYDYVGIYYGIAPGFRY